LIEDARARGVVFRGLGNEPGWMVEVGPVTSLVFETNYGAERHEFPNATSGGEVAAGRTWRAEQDGQTIEVVVKQEACHDDMSGQPYEYSFRVTFAGTTLQGCGARLQRG
jgi:putative lipoprotein